MKSQPQFVDKNCGSMLKVVSTGVRVTRKMTDELKGYVDIARQCTLFIVVNGASAGGDREKN